MLKRIETSKFFYFLAILLLPVNLAKHFEISGSFVYGVLVDYLIPTVYLIDVVVALTIFTWLFERGLCWSTKSPFFCFGSISIKELFRKNPYLQILLFFNFALFLSVFIAPVSLPALEGFLRLFGYQIFGLYIYCRVSHSEVKKSLSILSLSVLFVSFIGVIQFLMQGSVFDNYLFFGEYPYGVFSQHITRESIFGYSFIPPYGFFGHPNTFAGFLSLSIVFFFLKFREFDAPRKFMFLVLLASLLCLVLTISITAYLAVAVAFGFYYGRKYLAAELSRKLYLWLVVIMVSFSFLLPTFSSVIGAQNHIPVARRVYLQEAAYKMFWDKPLFGVGMRNFTVFLEDYVDSATLVGFRFIQPVHNVFLLLLSESGLFAFLSLIFLIFIYLKHRQSLLILTAIILGLFDHYLYTSSQALLLLIILVVFEICLDKKRINPL